MRFLLLEFDAKIKNPFRKRPAPPHEHELRPAAIKHADSCATYSMFGMGDRKDGPFTNVLFACKCGHREVRTVPGHWTASEMVGAEPLPDGDKIIAALMEKKQ